MFITIVIIIILIIKPTKMLADYIANRIDTLFTNKLTKNSNHFTKPTKVIQHKLQLNR